MAADNLIDLNSIYWKIPGKSDNREIIHNLELKIKTGDFVCIMGPTGCGKSTLLKIIAGLIKVEDGIYAYDGEMITTSIPKNKLKNVGIAYQSDSLCEWLTAEKNIRLPISVFGLKNEFDVSERVERMINLVGLKNYRDCYPHEMSGGMRQRCAFARALVHNPDVLLLDQPFGALDAITRKALGAELLKMWHEENKTVVMITNNVSEALMLANKVVVLSNAPATVVKEIKVNIPYEDRFKNLMENEEFNVLSEKLGLLVRAEKE